MIEKIGCGLQPCSLAFERHLIRPLNPFSRSVKAVCAHLEFVVQPLEEIRRLELFLELLGTGNLAVVLDFHALGVVDDHREITFLRQHRRDVQNRSKENEHNYTEGHRAQGH